MAGDAIAVDGPGIVIASDLSLPAALAILAAMQRPLPLNTPEVVVLRADDPQARGAVERILKEGYFELEPILRTFSLVVMKKPIRVMGGSVEVVCGTEFIFYSEVRSCPGADGLLVSRPRS